MSIASTAPVAPDAFLPTTALPATQVAGFDEMVASGLRDVNQALLRTELDAQRLAAGDAVDLHHIMINLEEAKASFQLMMQVRNRLLEAYQEVMRMQI